MAANLRMLVVILPSGSIGGFPPFRLVKFKPQIYGFFPKFNDGTNHMDNGSVFCPDNLASLFQFVVVKGQI